MKDLTADEIASTLLVRIVREIQSFAASSTIHEGESAEQMWSHFLSHLISRKELEGHL